jgi:hypothetical protein
VLFSQAAFLSLGIMGGSLGGFLLPAPKAGATNFSGPSYSIIVMAAEKNRQAVAIKFLPRRSPSPPNAAWFFFRAHYFLATT